MHAHGVLNPTPGLRPWPHHRLTPPEKNPSHREQHNQTEGKKNMCLEDVLHRPGIEPGASRWQRLILPLNHRCYFWFWMKIFKRLQTIFTFVYRILNEIFPGRRGQIDWEKGFVVKGISK